MTIDDNHGLCQNALHISQVYKLHRVLSMIEISIDPTVQILSRSHISWVSTPCSVDSKSATCPMIRRSKSDLNSMAQIISRFRWLCFLPLQVTVGEAPRWSWINGPKQTSIWWLRSNRDFAYHDFDGYVSCLSKSRVMNLGDGAGSTVQNKPWSDGCD